MKKAYKKPEIFFESFNLSSSIAAGCAEKAGHGEYICPVETDFGTGPIKIFADGEASGCDTYFSGVEDSLCYHVPSESLNIFAS